MNATCIHFIHSSLCLVFLCKDELTDLKLVIEDTIDNVATLQDCSVDQRESLQLSENRPQLTVKHMQSFNIKLVDYLTLLCEMPLRYPGRQDGADTRPGHHAGAEDHVS